MYVCILVHTFVYVNLFIYVYVYSYIHMYLYTCTYIPICTCMHIYIYICKYICIYNICKYTYSIYIYIYMYIYIYIFIHIYIWRYLIWCFDGRPPQQTCSPSLVLTSFKYRHACIYPTERGEACSERSDEGRDCTLHIVQTKSYK